MERGFDILYEDSDLLIVAKQAGLLTQAPLGIDSLEVRLKRFLAERQGGPGDVYLGIPHRLDRPVSGAMIFTKTVAAARRISRQFESRRVEKTYWALVAGSVEPEAGTWTDYLAKIEGEPRSIVVDAANPAGRTAILHYRSILTNPSLSPGLQAGSAAATALESERRVNSAAKWNVEDRATLLEIALETGRTHQIRVQCASRGHPLLGDELYGSRQPFGPWRDDERERLIALHARKLRVWQHPLRRYIEVVAPLPEYWPAAGIKEPT